MASLLPSLRSRAEGTLSRRFSMRVLERAAAVARTVIDVVEAVRPSSREAPILSVVEVAPSERRPTNPRRPTRPTPPEKKSARVPSSNGAASSLPPGLVEAAHLADVFRRRLDALGREKVLTAKAHDPTALHAMRVASRRMRAVLELFGPWLPGDDRERTRRRLRRVTRVLGPLREMDVFASAIDLRLAQAGDDVAMAAALEFCRAWVDKERAGLRKRAAKRLRKLEPTRLRTELRPLTDRVVARFVTADVPPASAAWEVLGRRIDSAFEDAPHPPADDLELHELRTQMKRLRYAFELLSPLLGSKYEPLRARTKAAQRAIGHLRDHEMLLGLFRDQAQRLREQKLGTLHSGLTRTIAAMEVEAASLRAVVPSTLAALDRAYFSKEARNGLGLPTLPRAEASAPAS